MAKQEYNFTMAQLDALATTDARRLGEALAGAAQDASGDQMADLIIPLIHMIERSLLTRPASDLEVLATKVRIACGPCSDPDSTMLALMQDVDRILSGTA